MSKYEAFNRGFFRESCLKRKNARVKCHAFPFCLSTLQIFGVFSSFRLWITCLPTLFQTCCATDVVDFSCGVGQRI
ncbi:hypothetical protein GYMLUDRAFT_367312 [Collybiopsis luxurians FD-317 M1]|nr:hypothetical protein GYMLUDRAFT_367312 [Collybiopsis luxurians FD-317 M1]